MTSFSTTFPTAENPVSAGGGLITSTSPGVNWSGLGLGASGTLPVAPVDVVAPSEAELADYANSNFGDALAVATGTWSPDQSASVVVGNLAAQAGGFEEFEIHLRTDPTTGAGYEITWGYNNNYIAVATWNAHGGYTNLYFAETSQTLHPGDTLSASIQGSVIKIFTDGALVATVNDHTFTTGNPGFGFNQGGTHEYDISSFSASDSGTSPPPSALATTIQNDYLGITRELLSVDQAALIASAINAGTQSETGFVNSLFPQVANTSIPAVAVEATMYGAVGTSNEVTALATQFLPAQAANAIAHGFNPQVYASEALGLVLAFGNENGSTAFADNFGPSSHNPALLPDSGFASAAASTIFGSASTPTIVNAIESYVANWEAFYSANGIPGNAHPSLLQIDIAARGAAWGDAVGLALANNLGPLLAQVINFLDDAAQGSAQYSVSLVGQPAHHEFA